MMSIHGQCLNLVLIGVLTKTDQIAVGSLTANSSIP
jgi:hypothetical protein